MTTNTKPGRPTGGKLQCHFATRELAKRLAARIVPRWPDRATAAAACGLTHKKLTAFIQRSSGLTEADFNRLCDVFDICE